jgi:hypothetical protein
VSDGLGDLQRRLESITSEHCPPDAPLDAESAALRGAWLAFGKLLEASQGEQRQQAPPSPLAVARQSRKKRLLAAAAALAGSLLIAVGIGWYLRLAGPPAASPLASPSSGGLAVNESKRSPAPPSGPTRPLAGPSREANLKWEDPLDREIGVAGRATVQAGQDELASAAGAGLLRYELEELGKGVRPGSF